MRYAGVAHRVPGAQGDAATGFGLAHAIGAARLALTGGLLAFGIWAALPALSDIQLPSPLALPTALALPQPIASTASGATAVRSAPASVQQSGRSPAVSLSLSDRDLTAAAQPYFPRTYAGVTVGSPSVRVTSGQIVLSATARSFLGSSSLVARATPYASGGRLMLRVDSATLGGMSLPDATRAQIAQQLQAAIDASTGSRLQVSGVTASAGALTLSGTALPN